MKSIGIRLSSEELDVLSQLAKERGVTRGRLISEAIAYGLPLVKSRQGLDYHRLVVLLEFLSFAKFEELRSTDPDEAQRILQVASERAATLHG